MKTITRLFPTDESEISRGLFTTLPKFTIPSGVLTTAPTVISRIAREIPEIGFLTTKTLSINPRDGYREPIIHEYYPGCFVNAVGLANPGAAIFAEAMKPLLPLYGRKPLVVSIMGSDPDEFLECALILDEIADAFELNLSCPHVKSAGQSVGSDPIMVERVVKKLCQRLKKPIIPKLSPNLSNIVDMAKLCAGAGAAGLSLINTVGPGTAVDTDGEPVLSNIVGGISGASIRPIGLKIVREVSDIVKLPIIASGGISSPEDVEAYRKAGATYFAVGSGLAGMTTRRVKKFFQWLDGPVGLGQPNRRKRKALSCEGRTRYLKTRVTSCKSISLDMFKLELEEGPNCDPGQFFFLRIPGLGEKPFSPMSDVRPVYLIRTVGPFTNGLSTLREGDSIYLRGPYGTGFKSPSNGDRIVVVGGGTGVAPILMAANKWSKSIYRTFMGFSHPAAQWFLDEAKLFGANVEVAIDGPCEVGAILGMIESEFNALQEFPPDLKVYICGPTVMMKKAGELFSRFIDKKNIYIAREDVMKCGIGLCGSCSTEEGLRSCVDGPVFSFN